MPKCLWCGKESKHSVCSSQCRAYYLMFLRNRISSIDQARSGYAYKGRTTENDKDIIDSYSKAIETVSREV